MLLWWIHFAVAFAFVDFCAVRSPLTKERADSSALFSLVISIIISFLFNVIFLRCCRFFPGFFSDVLPPRRNNRSILIPARASVREAGAAVELGNNILSRYNHRISKFLGALLLLYATGNEILYVPVCIEGEENPEEAFYCLLLRHQTVLTQTTGCWFWDERHLSVQKAPAFVNFSFIKNN